MTSHDYTPAEVRAALALRDASRNARQAEDTLDLLTGSVERSCAVMAWLGCRAIELPDAGPDKPRRRWWR